ncbi:multiple epidermal growth factor-like domains protein 10 isoform X2 [Saccostrea cucullata]|uniref:multiple epidermal growth factor-like domains protein 10 isoform X2 n=1 Tax=Saccostrea cuccullata TaxID=36930 RepID=UPI002ED6825E
MNFISILLFLVPSYLFHNENNMCERFDDCCQEWDDFSMNCKVCSPGYIGPNCSQICPYPNYGSECQGRCNCDERLCDITTGCYDDSEGCRRGYFGDRCVHRCRFPNYGKYCQQVCQCKQSDCGHVTGCRQIQVTYNNSVTQSQSKEENSTEVPNLVIIISSALTFVVVLSVVIKFVFCRRSVSSSESQQVSVLERRGCSNSINYFVDSPSQRYSSMYETPRCQTEPDQIFSNQQRESSCTKIYPLSSDYYEPVDAYAQLQKVDGAECTKGKPFP